MSLGALLDNEVMEAAFGIKLVAKFLLSLFPYNCGIAEI